jgi:hypothetical protein
VRQQSLSDREAHRRARVDVVDGEQRSSRTACRPYPPWTPFQKK